MKNRFRTPVLGAALALTVISGAVAGGTLFGNDTSAPATLPASERASNSDSTPPAPRSKAARAGAVALGHAVEWPAEAAAIPNGDVFFAPAESPAPAATPTDTTAPGEGRAPGGTTPAPSAAPERPATAPASDSPTPADTPSTPDEGPADTPEGSNSPGASAGTPSEDSDPAPESPLPPPPVSPTPAPAPGDEGPITVPENYCPDPLNCIEEHNPTPPAPADEPQCGVNIECLDPGNGAAPPEEHTETSDGTICLTWIECNPPTIPGLNEGPAIDDPEPEPGFGLPVEEIAGF